MSELITQALTRRLTNEIIARLEAGLSEAAKVEEFPQQPDPKRYTAAKPAIWVGYSGSTYSTPETTDVPTQAREMHFDVTLLSRQLHGPRGASGIIDAVREVLHGHRCTAGGTALYLVRDGFSSYADGVWRHFVTIATRLPSVPPTAGGDGDAGPRLVRARFARGEEIVGEVPSPDDDPEPPEEP